MNGQFSQGSPQKKGGLTTQQWLIAGLVVMVVVLISCLSLTIGFSIRNIFDNNRTGMTADNSTPITPEVIATNNPTKTPEVIATPSPDNSTTVPSPDDPTPTPTATLLADPDPDFYVYACASCAIGDGFDPAVNNHFLAQSIFLNSYETLVTYKREDPTRFNPQLASEFYTSSNGRVYKFPIREGIKFHKGGTLTAEDVAYTFQRSMLMGHPDSAHVYFAEAILGVGIHNVALLVDDEMFGQPHLLKEAPSDKLRAVCEQVKEAIQTDGNIVTITLKQPWQPFLAMLAVGGWGAIMDKQWVIENDGWDGQCSTWQNYYAIGPEENPFTKIDLINGTGPYQYESGDEEEGSIIFIANEHYWRRPPQISRVVWELLDKQEESISQLKTGEADSAYVRPYQFPELDSLVGERCTYNEQTRDFDCTATSHPNNSLRSYEGHPSNTREDVLFVFDINDDEENPYIGSGRLDGQGIRPDFFSDIHVRRAFNYCFDWSRYIELTLNDEAIQNVGPLIPTQLGYNPNGPKYSLNLDKCAKELEMAWDGDVAENGFRLQLPYYRVVLQILQENLAKVDSRYVIEILEDLPEDFDGNYEVRSGRLPLYIAGWAGLTGDPHGWAGPFLVGYHARTQRIPQETIDIFSPLVNQAAMEENRDKRQEIYEKLTELDYENAIAIRLASRTSERHYEHRWVKGWYYNPVLSGFYYYALEK